MTIVELVVHVALVCEDVLDHAIWTVAFVSHPVVSEIALNRGSG